MKHDLLLSDKKADLFRFFFFIKYRVSLITSLCLPDSNILFLTHPLCFYLMFSGPHVPRH